MKQPDTPKLDAVDMTATANGRSERLSEVEFLLLEQLLRYPEQAVSRVSLTTIIEDQAATLSDSGRAPPLADRVIDKLMLQVTQKTNALYTGYPLVRRLGRDSWLYTEVAPRRRVKP